MFSLKNVKLAKFALIVTAVFVVFVIANNLTEETKELSVSTAISLLTDILLKQGVEFGGEEEKLAWDLDSIYIIEIEGTAAYAIYLRYGDDIESVMAFRRYGTYAISQDGHKAYFLNIATDQWEPLN